jgi:hypothetical protein
MQKNSQKLAGIEILNLWNDFRKVVKLIDENPWVKPMLEKNNAGQESLINI